MAYLALYRRDGQRLGAYYNPGLFYDVLVDDIDGDGRDEILAAGTNNPHDGATIILLDEAHCWGAAVDSRVNPRCALQDSSLARVILPPFEQRYLDLMRIERLVAMDLNVARGAGGVARITCSVGDDQGHMPFVVSLDETLSPLSAVVAGKLHLATRRWPEDAARTFLSEEFRKDWLARRYLYGALHSQLQ